jgi:hypothetical protein
MTNVCDRAYFGPANAVSLFTPLLKPRSANPHATLLLLFQNAIAEIYNGIPPVVHVAESKTTQKILTTNYLPFPTISNAYDQKWNPDVHRYQGGADMLRDFDKPWPMFVQQVDLVYLLGANGFRTKEPEEHTITKAWSKRVGKGASKEEFMMKLATCYKGFERYVECVRME